MVVAYYSECQFMLVHYISQHHQNDCNYDINLSVSCIQGFIGARGLGHSPLHPPPLESCL